MMKEKRPTRRSRRTMGSLALAGSLTAIAVALGAGDVKSPPTKEQMHARMAEIPKQLAQLEGAGATRDIRLAIDQLLREYRRLSQALGGNDPAGLLAGDPTNPAPPSNADGGIASAPPAPAGCTSTTTNFSNAVATPIPNVSTAVVYTSTITVSGLDPVIWDVNATTFITHTFASDLDITLTSPAGTVVTLATDNGSSFDNVYNGTVWDDDANPAGQVPYTNNNGMATDHGYADLTLASPLVPEEAMGAFIGEDPNGVWTLSVVDDAAADTGTLTSWSLDITTVPAAPTTTLTTASVNPALVIPTGPGVVSSTITVAGAQPFITDVNSTTFITHTNNIDLDITLQSPAGTVVTLTSDNGGTNDNVFNGTLWDDDANPGGSLPHTSNNGVVTDHTYVNLTPASPLVPEEALAAFINENPNGDWILTISDDASSNGGTLASWSLDILATDPSPTTTTTSFSNTTPVDIQVAQPATSTVVVSGVGTYLWDLDLNTILNHTSSGDLDVTLQSPAGTIVTITTDNGTTLDNVYGGTLWDDDANPVGQVPYTSNNGVVTDQTYVNLTAATPLSPEEALGAFIGEDPNGTWTITLHDDGTNADTGTLTSWSVDVTTLDQAPTDASSQDFANTTPVTIATTAPPQVLTSTVTVAGTGTFLRDVNLSFNISHTDSSDLDITLQSPAGTIVTITTDNGGANDNVFAGTTFNDDADPDGQVPFTNNNGSVTDHLYANLVVATPLTPEEPLAAFIGEDPNGTWTLTISDDATGDGGALNSWSLDIVTCECAGGPVCDADIDGDTQVDVNDLLAVINAWGPCPAPCPPACAADIDPVPAGDCMVDVNDLLLVINSWGPCP